MLQEKPFTTYAAITGIVLYFTSVFLDNVLVKPSWIPFRSVAICSGISTFVILWVYQIRKNEKVTPGKASMVAVALNLTIFMALQQFMFWVYALVVWALFTAYFWQDQEKDWKTGIRKAGVLALLFFIPASIFYGAMKGMNNILFLIMWPHAWDVQDLLLKISVVTAIGIGLVCLIPKEHSGTSYKRIEKWITQRVSPIGAQEGDFKRSIQKLCDEEKAKGRDVRGFQAYIDKNAYRKLFETKKK